MHSFDFASDGSTIDGPEPIIEIPADDTFDYFSDFTAQEVKPVPEPTPEPVIENTFKVDPSTGEIIEMPEIKAPPAPQPEPATPPPAEKPVADPPKPMNTKVDASVVVSKEELNQEPLNVETARVTTFNSSPTTNIKGRRNNSPSRKTIAPP